MGFKSIIVLIIVIMLSLFSGQVLSVLLTISIYVCGHGLTAPEVLKFAEKKPFIKNILQVYSTFFPNLDKLNLKGLVLVESHFPTPQY